MSAQLAWTMLSNGIGEAAASSSNTGVNEDRTQHVFIDHMTLENTPLAFVLIANA